METRRSVVVCSRAAKNAMRSGSTLVSAISPETCMRSGTRIASSNNCGTSRPSRSATSTNARTCCACAPEGAGAFTAPAAGRPSSASATSRASSTAIRSSASCVEPPRCGVAKTLGCACRRTAGEFGGGGSSLTTSIAAARSVCASSAASSASSSKTPPRAQLTIAAPGFMHANAAASMSPRVCCVSGTCSVTMSEDCSSCSNETSLRVQSFAARLRNVRIVRENLHAEGAGAHADRAADST